MVFIVEDIYHAQKANDWSFPTTRTYIAYCRHYTSYIRNYSFMVHQKQNMSKKAPCALFILLTDTCYL